MQNEYALTLFKELNIQEGTELKIRPFCDALGLFTADCKDFKVAQNDITALNHIQERIETAQALLKLAKDNNLLDECVDVVEIEKNLLAMAEERKKELPQAEERKEELPEAGAEAEAEEKTKEQARTHATLTDQDIRVAKGLFREKFGDPRQYQAGLNMCCETDGRLFYAEIKCRGHHTPNVTHEYFTLAKQYFILSEEDIYMSRGAGKDYRDNPFPYEVIEGIKKEDLLAMGFTERNKAEDEEEKKEQARTNSFLTNHDVRVAKWLFRKKFGDPRQYQANLNMCCETKNGRLFFAKIERKSHHTPYVTHEHNELEKQYFIMGSEDIYMSRGDGVEYKNKPFPYGEIEKIDEDEKFSRDPPDELCCPITKSLMRYPITLNCCGQTVERAYILGWNTDHSSCPLCREPLPHNLARIAPGTTLKAQCERFRREHLVVNTENSTEELAALTKNLTIE
jgi:hypothetical protein